MLVATRRWNELWNDLHCWRFGQVWGWQTAYRHFIGVHYTWVIFALSNTLPLFYSEDARIFSHQNNRTNHTADYLANIRPKFLLICQNRQERSLALLLMNRLWRLFFFFFWFFDGLRLGSNPQEVMVVRWKCNAKKWTKAKKFLYRSSAMRFHVNFDSIFALRLHFALLALMFFFFFCIFLRHRTFLVVAYFRIFCAFTWHFSQLCGALTVKQRRKTWIKCKNAKQK